MKGTVEERFWAKVNTTDTCWLWTAYKDRNGYGFFGKDGRTQMAHRVAYELTKGTIPQGMEIDHTCHNRSCVNPGHMRLVTRKQNTENRSGARAGSKSGIRGVSHHKASGLWRAGLCHGGKKIHLGYFEDPVAAGEAVKARRLELYTHNDVDRRAS